MAIVKISDLPLVDQPVEGTDLFVVVQDNVTKKAYASDIQTYVGFEEVQTATAGQNVFTLTTMTYAAGANNLQVFVDGVNQYEGSSYQELDNNTVMFSQGLHEGALVKFSTVQTQTSEVANANAVTFLQAGTGAIPRSVQSKERDIVSVKDFGAVGDNLTDDTAAIQAALNYINSVGGGEVYMPRGTYRTSAPLLIYNHTALVGDGSMATKIIKTNNAVSNIGTILAPARLPAFADNYNVDSIISVVHPPSQYNAYIRIEGIQISGNYNTYGIYFPRGFNNILHDLVIILVQNGVFARDVFMTEISRVYVSEFQIGFNWAADGSGLGTGTSINFTNCFTNGSNLATGGLRAYGFKLQGLNYSTITSCGCDAITSAGGEEAYSYWFESCRNITLTGCGTEGVTGGEILAESSAITLVGFDGSFSISGKTFDYAVAIIRASASRLSMLDCTFPVIANPGNIYNIETTNGSHIVATNCIMPSGGNTFNNFNGGSTITEFKDGVQTVKVANGVTRTYRPIERGSATFAAATTRAVTFGTAQVDTNYYITIAANANKTFWVTSKTTSGFTLNASAVSSDTVDWMLVR